MKKKNQSIIKRIQAGALGLIALTNAAVAQGPMQDSQQLKGDYTAVINQTCVRTPFQQPLPVVGFDAATKKLLVEGEALTALGKGLLRLERDGTAQLLNGIQTEVSLAPLTVENIPIAPPAKFSCTGKYTLDSRKMFLTLSCEVEGPPNIRIMVGAQEFEGEVDPDDKTIQLTNLAGGIQSITVVAFGNPVQQRQRICTQHASITKVGGGSRETQQVQGRSH